MKIAVIIPAAGVSQRYTEAAQRDGLAGRSKLDEDLGGRPVLHRTVELFDKRPEVQTIIVAGPADEAAMAAFRDRHGDRLGLLGVQLCPGGRTHRWETVRAALALVPEHCTHVAVHDAARPCAPAELIDRVFRMAEEHAAVVPVVRMSDTIKRLSDGPVAATKSDPLDAILGPAGDAGPGAFRVVETVDRAGLACAQTPQVFERSLLQRAYAQKDLAGTDDSQLVERLGEPVIAIDGDVRNIKITVPSDLRLARSILHLKPPSEREAHKRF